MPRSCSISISALGFFALGILAAAQSAASPQASPPAQAGVAAQLEFGTSLSPLSGPWKFQLGDSPPDPQDDTPLWAEPSFDDSRWEPMDLTPIPGIRDPYTGDPQFIPGWGSKGHPGYMGWAWYRLTVAVSTQSDEQLALAGPIMVEDSYQVFANGRLLGGMGKFGGPGEPPVVYATKPAMFILPQLPNSPLSRKPTPLTLAFRVWLGPVGLSHSPFGGGIHYAPLLGEARAVAAQVRLEWLEWVRAIVVTPFEAILLVLLSIVFASLVIFDRSDSVYLWIAGSLLWTAFLQSLVPVACWTQWLSRDRYFLILEVFGRPLSLGGWMMVWWVWFRLHRPTWMPQAIAALTLLYMLLMALGGGYLKIAFLPPSGVFLSASLAVRLIYLLLLVFIIGLGIREQGKEGWLVLPAIVPFMFSHFEDQLRLLHIPVVWTPSGIVVFTGDVDVMLLAAVISFMLLRRLLQSVRRQRLMALDVKQAQEVQHVILPEAGTVFPGLLIESEYRPAREVGGDFFQIIPNADGSLLIVAGDVAGKGLQAGMLVALLVGAIRSTARFCSDPLVVLNELNQRLLGRGDAQATCLAMSIGKDGSVTLANAGHMAPYLNGEPVDMEGALPLGIIDGAEPSVMQFQLRNDDKLMLMSDGIVEATDAEGNLFGFERIEELLRTATTAAELAVAAQRFGQEDDISVISVTRTAGPAPAPA